jgi:hypothetical protein
MKTATQMGDLDCDGRKGMVWVKKIGSKLQPTSGNQRGWLENHL